MLMKDKIRNLPLNLLPGYWIEKGVTEEASGENVLLIDLDVSSLNEPFQLERGIILWDLKDIVFRSSRNEFGVSSQNHASLLTSPPNQRINIFTSIIDCVVSQHSQFLSQFPEHTIDNELHFPRPSPSPHRACQQVGRGEGWGERVEGFILCAMPAVGRPSALCGFQVFPNDRFQILFRLVGDVFFAGDESIF